VNPVRPRLRRPAAPPQPAESTGQLINIAFLLLVFALLAGRLDATAPFAMTPPVSALGGPLAQGGLTVSIGPDGALALDGAPAEAAAAVAAVAAEAAAGASPFVRLNADADAPLRHLLPLAAALAEAGAREVVLIVTPAAP
jgi:biopolymer transport protein ExbD